MDDDLDRAVRALGCDPRALDPLLDEILIKLDAELGREPTDEEYLVIGAYVASIVAASPYIRLVLSGDGADLPLGAVVRRVVQAAPELDKLVKTWGSLFKLEDWAREMRVTVREDLSTEKP